MTTDLKSKTVVELALYFGSLHDQACNAIVAFDELARRLEEAQQQLELYAAEMSAAREAGFYSAQELWSAYQTVQQRNAAHDAKVAAEAKAEALEELQVTCSAFGIELPRIVDKAAAEYRAKAGRKE